MLVGDWCIQFYGVVCLGDEGKVIEQGGKGYLVYGVILVVGVGLGF